MGTPSRDLSTSTIRSTSCIDKGGTHGRVVETKLAPSLDRVAEHGWDDVGASLQVLRLSGLEVPSPTWGMHESRSQPHLGEPHRPIRAKGLVARVRVLRLRVKSALGACSSSRRQQSDADCTRSMFHVKAACGMWVSNSGDMSGDKAESTRLALRYERHIVIKGFLVTRAFLCFPSRAGGLQ